MHFPIQIAHNMMKLKHSCSLLVETPQCMLVIAFFSKRRTFSAKCLNFVQVEKVKMVVLHSRWDFCLECV